MSKYIIQISLTLFICFTSCKNENTKVSLATYNESTEQTENKSEDCNDYLTEMIKSSTFPFETYKVKKEDIHLLIDEEDETVILAKVFIKTDGTGTLGWIEFNKNEKTLYNTSANLDNPQFLNYDSDWLHRYEECITKRKSILSESIENCIVNPNTPLPYSENHKGLSTYLTLNCPIKNIEDWLCDRNALSYKPIMLKDKISLILVPQECADFSYRFYLLTLKDNEIVSSLYAEGEWYEPGDEENIETTSFKIQKDSIIEVITKNKNGEPGINDNQYFEIRENGNFKQIKK